MASSFWARPKPNSSILSILHKAFIEVKEDSVSDVELQKQTKPSSHATGTAFTGGDGNDNVIVLDDKLLTKDQILITSSTNNLKYRPNLQVLDDFLKDEDLSRNLFLEPEDDPNETGLTLEDYFTNPLVLNQLLDYILDEKFCVEEKDQETELQNKKNKEHKDDNQDNEVEGASKKNAMKDLDESLLKRQKKQKYYDDDDDDEEEEEEQKKKEEENEDGQDDDNEKKHEDKLVSSETPQKKSFEDSDDSSDSSDDEEFGKFDNSLDDPELHDFLDESKSRHNGLEGDDDDENKNVELMEFFTKATVAAEILSIDLMEITASFFSHDILISKLWFMLDKYSTLSQNASSSFLKINERLLQYAEIGGLFGGNNGINDNSNSNNNFFQDALASSKDNDDDEDDDDDEEDDEGDNVDLFTKLNNGENVAKFNSTKNNANNKDYDVDEDAAAAAADDDDDEDDDDDDNDEEKLHKVVLETDEQVIDADEDDLMEGIDSNTIEITGNSTVLDRFLHIIIHREKLVDKFVKHIELAPLMDFLLKIISTDKPELPTYVTLFLKNHQLIEKLLFVLDGKNSATAQSTATDFLKALIAISANSNSEIASAIGPNELTRYLVSSKMIQKMGDLMLQGGLPLSNCVGIIIEIIRKNNSDYDFVQVMYTTLESNPPDMRDPIYLGHLVKFFAENLSKFNDILLSSNKVDFQTPFGLIEPLGVDRFKICELVAELLHCSNMALLNELGGENVVEERDVVRAKTVKDFLKLNFKIDTPEVLEFNDCVPSDATNKTITPTKTNSDDEHLNIKIENLNIKSEENSSEDNLEQQQDEDFETPKIDAETNDPNDKTIEGNDDDAVNHDESSAEALRMDPVVGDQLKIALQDSNIVDVILKMLFHFPWNNFLHNVVFDIVQQILNGPLKEGYNKFLIADLFKRSNITHFIVSSDEYCQRYEEEKNLRLGYMGHLTLIAEEVAKFAAYLDEMDIVMHDAAIENALKESEWVKYTDVVLSETREKYSTVFGDFNVDLYDVLGGEEDDGEDAEDISDDMVRGPNGTIHGNSLGDDDDYDEDDDDEYNATDNGNRSHLSGFKNDMDPSIDDDIPLNLRPYNSRYGEDHEDDEEQELDYSDEDNDEDEEARYGADKNEDLYGEDIEVTLNSHFHRMADSNGNSKTKNSDAKKKTLFDLLNEEEESSTSHNSKDHKSSMHTSSDDDDFDDDSHSPYSKQSYNSLNNYKPSLTSGTSSQEDEDDDDYIDPNDDGLSYAKPGHPLYSDSGKTFSEGTKMDLVDDEDDDVYEDAGDLIDDLDDDESGVSLSRQKTSDNMQWDQQEQNRIFGYKRLHNKSD